MAVLAGNLCLRYVGRTELGFIVVEELYGNARLALYVKDHFVVEASGAPIWTVLAVRRSVSFSGKCLVGQTKTVCSWRSWARRSRLSRRLSKQTFPRRTIESEVHRLVATRALHQLHGIVLATRAPHRTLVAVQQAQVAAKAEVLVRIARFHTLRIFCIKLEARHTSCARYCLAG